MLSLNQGLWVVGTDIVLKAIIEYSSFKVLCFLLYKLNDFWSLILHIIHSLFDFLGMKSSNPKWYPIELWLVNLDIHDSV